MAILPISSLQALVTTVAKTITTHAPKRAKQRHIMHYLLKGVGKLPTPLLERLNGYLKSPTAKQYPHADAHLRLIFGANRKLKQPLQLTELLQLRQKFAHDMVEMQSPNVWQQAHNDGSFESNWVNNSNIKNVSVKNQDNSSQNINNAAKPHPVRWQDKVIANADGGDMTLRCYQEAEVDEFENESSEHSNPDKVVMLFFHGGGFCIGDINTHHEFCHTVCAQTGWALVSVDYRLAPEHPAPTALRDCLAAYIWLAEHAHSLDVLPSRIVLAGDSAGGCLAALVAQQVSNAVAMPSSEQQQYKNSLDNVTADIFQQLQNIPRPLAQLSLYPVTDIETNYPSWALYGEDLLLDHDDVAVFDAAYMQHSPLSRQHVLISPMFGDNKALCPSYIVASELDVLRDEAIAYAQQLQSYGIKVETHTVLGAPHGFIHLMSVHRRIGRETDYIINDFAAFVRQIIA